MPPPRTPSMQRQPTNDGHLRSPSHGADATVHNIPVLEAAAPAAGERKRPSLPEKKRTQLTVWCGAALCFAFSLLLIAAGVITLVVFTVIRPRYPRFDASGATLNGIYLDSPGYLNGDFSLLANFSNPNRKIDVRFEVVSLELYFHNTLVAAQGSQPFVLRRGEVRLESLHMVSSEVYLTPELVGEMQRQVGSNRVVYSIRGTFKVRGSLGFIHFAYWLNARCTMELTRPPSGVLVAKTCRTTR